MYRLLSFEFALSTGVPGASERVATLLAPFRASPLGSVPHVFELTRDGGLFVVVLDGDVVHRSGRLGGAIDWILWKASTEAIAGIDDHIAIHAGAVAWNGNAVLLPAPPDSGKTTLTAALTAAGFSYLSDEAALIHPSTGKVVPFPRALWLESGSVEVLDAFLSRRAGGRVRRDGTAHVAPADLRRGRIGRPSRVRHVVFPRYAPGSPTSLRPMSRAEGLIDLGRNAFNLQRFGGRGVDVLADVVRDADVHRLALDDLDAAVTAISALVDPTAGRRDHVVNGAR